MLAPADLAAIPLFATVPLDTLARVLETAADLHLAPGEFAVHEGDERALFVVLAGQIEVTKSVDGVRRRIGGRAPGQIFGEVPIIFGTPFQGSYHATQPSRVLRLEGAQFHVLAAASAQFADAIAALGRERMGGLQGIATAPTQVRAILVGDRFDGACHALRNFLARNQIPFAWLLPDAPDLAARWPGPPLAAGDHPALACADGRVLLRAGLRDVAVSLGLQTQPRAAEYDAAIIGAGPAGLAAGVYGASEGLRTIVIERAAPGGQAGTSSRIENYLGFPTGVSGDELARRALEQATRLGAEIIVTRAVEGVDPDARVVLLDGGERLRARTIVVASGVTWRRLAIDGVDRLLGKGVFYGAARSDAGLTQGRDVHLVGAGNSAGQAALFFAGHARSVTLVVRGEALERGMSHYLVEQLRGKSNIAVELGAEIVAVHGGAHVEAIDLRAGGTTQRRDSGGVFIFIGADAETGWLPEAIARDGRGYVLTGDGVVRAGRWRGARDPYLLETSVPGIFACGDVRASPVKRVAAAVGEGGMAIAFIQQFLSASV